MRSSLAQQVTHVFGQAFLARPGAGGRLLLSWTMAGGIAGGGVLIGALALVGAVQPGVHLFAAQALFVVGGVGGLIHASVLSIAGRPDCLSVGGACWRSTLAGLVCIPALGVAWVVTAGMSRSAALLTSWEVSWLVVAVASWAAGLAFCVWAAVEGWQAVRRALSRWAPDFGVGSGVLVLTVGFLGAALFWSPREALGFDLQLIPAAAMLLGVGAAFSIGLPLVCTLHVVRGRLVPPRSGHRTIHKSPIRNASIPE